MTDPIVNELLHPWFMPALHSATLRLVQDLSDEQFAKAPSATAPPIGWHVFHIARFADRLQASLPNRLPEESHDLALPRQIWFVEDVANVWGVNSTALGWLETGAGMTIGQAVDVASVGRKKITAYAEKAFFAADNAAKQLQDHELTQQRYSIMPEFRVDETGVLNTTGPRQTTVLFDLLFHNDHGKRHLGMIEALRGAMFSMVGTASV